MELDAGPAVETIVRHGVKAAAIIPAHGHVIKHAQELANSYVKELAGTHAQMHVKMIASETAKAGVLVAVIHVLGTALAFALDVMICVRLHAAPHAPDVLAVAVAEKHVGLDALWPAQINALVPVQMAVLNSVVDAGPAVRQTVRQIVDLDARTHVTAR